MAKVPIKNKGGAPALFTDPLIMDEEIQKYFDSGIEERTFVVGSGANKQTIRVKIPTITGLCLYLGFVNRASFYDYEKRDKFSNIIKKARTIIERCYEEQLQYGNTVGAIFALKNMGWADKTEIDHTTRGDKIGNNLTDEEIDERINKIIKQGKQS